VFKLDVTNGRLNSQEEPSRSLKRGNWLTSCLNILPKKAASWRLWGIMLHHNKY